jgi:hypothetical protein
LCQEALNTFTAKPSSYSRGLHDEILGNRKATRNVHTYKYARLETRKNARFLRNEEEPAREASLGVHMRLHAATGEWNQKRDMKGGGKLVSQSAGVARDTRNLPNRENGNRLISNK